MARQVARRWMTVRDVCEYTGYSARAIRARIAKGDLPAYVPKGSRLLRIDQADVDAWLKSGGRVPSGHLNVSAGTLIDPVPAGKRQAGTS